MPGENARRVADLDILLLELNGGIQYATRIDLVRDMLSGIRTRAPLWRKYQGRLVIDGLLFPAQTGKTVYAWTDKKRWRFATWQFSRTIEKPGIISEALFCPPRPEVTA